MMEVGFAGRVGERPVAFGAVLFLDDGGEAELPVGTVQVGAGGEGGGDGDKGRSVTLMTDGTTI